MNVSEALKNRQSTRAYTNEPVESETLKQIFVDASRSPSGGNLQPWRIYLLVGEQLTEFKSLMKTRLGGERHPEGDTPEYNVYPPKLKEPYRTSRYEVGEDMYGLLGIGREDKAKRLEWFANNYQFFGAPAAAFCFVDRVMGPPQWSDLGMYLQSVMLLLEENGIASCAQECWSMYPKTVHDFCKAPEELMLFCGMAIGYADKAHDVNSLHTKRLDPSEWLTVL